MTQLGCIFATCLLLPNIAILSGEKNASERILINQAFLESHREDLSIHPMYISGNGTFHCKITVGAELFRSHVETREIIKMESGMQIRSQPVQYKDNSRSFRAQFRRASKSQYELKFRQKGRDVVYVLPFSVLRNAEGYWIAY